VEGILKAFDSLQGIGIISAKDGSRYPVILADILTPKTIKAGQPVYFSVRFVRDQVFATNVNILRASALENP
jgi:cold shock CspA family protein